MKHFFITLIFINLIGCSQNNIKSTYKEGDIVSFSIDSSQYGSLLIVKANKEKGRVIYWVCFTNYNDTVIQKNLDINNTEIAGRKVASGIDKKGYEIMLDISYVPDTLIERNSFLTGNLLLDTKKLQFGSEGYIIDYKQLLFTYRREMIRRKLPPDHYNDFLNKVGQEFRPEEFFPLKSFIKNM